MHRGLAPVPGALLLDEFEILIEHDALFAGERDETLAARAAHERARALDPTILTSVAHTCWLLGDYDVALRETAGDIGYMSGLALASTMLVGTIW